MLLSWNLYSIIDSLVMPNHCDINDASASAADTADTADADAARDQTLMGRGWESGWEGL